MKHITKVLMKEFVTHDVIRFIVEKPEGYEFTPGQATLVSINNEKWKDNEEHPFTFTCLKNDLALEFIVKIYQRGGMTQDLAELKAGDELILRDVWGSINYSGKGVFIAGGVGITPFIAILRDLKEEGKIKGNSLIFSNKKKKDVVLEKEFRELFDKEHLMLVLTEDVAKENINQEHPDKRYIYNKIDKKFLESYIKDFSQKFYVCGPPSFVSDITQSLKELGANSEEVIIEK